MHFDFIHRTEKQTGIKCLYTNTDCLKNKLEEIETFCHEENIDIVAVTETLSKKAENDENFNLPGYIPFPSNEGRGVCMFIKDKYKPVEMKNINKVFEPVRLRQQ